MKPDKALIQKKFGKAASHYDRSATPQIRIADTLVGRLSALMFEQSHRPVHKVLEIGCGTGLFSKRMVALLGSEGIDYHFNDISPEVQSELAQKLIGLSYTFHAFDAEHTAWGDGYDLIASSSCIQWWEDPLSFIGKAYKALEPNGMLVLSTFLPDNLQEIHSIQPSRLPYPSQEELELAMQSAGFSHYEMNNERIELSFSNLLELLRHLKETGTNAIEKNKTFWTPLMLRQIEKKLRDEQNLPEGVSLKLTYNSIIITAIK